MARYILIDSNSGYVVADTAIIPGFDAAGTPVEAAKIVDEQIGERGREYEFLSRDPHDGSDGYRVYRANVRGGDAVPLVADGTDQELIEAVERDCDYEGFVVASRE